MIGFDEAKHHGSVGLLAENMEAKIVDPVTGEALSPGQRGELWIRGPTIMKGNYCRAIYMQDQWCFWPNAVDIARDI